MVLKANCEVERKRKLFQERGTSWKKPLKDRRTNRLTDGRKDELTGLVGLKRCL